MKSIISFGVLFNGVRFFTGAFSVIYMMRNGLSVTEVGVIKSVQSLVMLLLDVPLSYMSDRYSHKFSMILAAVCSSLWLFMMGNSSSFHGFVFAEVFNALSLTLISGAYNAILISEAKFHNIAINKYFSINHMYNYFGMFLFSAVGAMIADVMFRGVWYFASATMFTVALIACYILRDNPTEKMSGIHYTHSFFSDFVLLCGHIVKNKIIAILFVYVCVVFNISAQYWQVLFGSLSHIKNTQLGIAFSLLILSQSLAGVLYTRLCGMKLNILLLVSSVLVSVLLAQKPVTYPEALLSVCMIFFLIRLAMIFVESEVHRQISDELRASFESLLSSFTNIVLLVMYPLSGLAIDTQGFSIVSYPLVFLALIFIGYQFFQCWFKRGGCRSNG